MNPSNPLRSPRTTIVAMAVVAALLVGAIVVVITRSGDDAKPVAARSSTSTASTTTTLPPPPTTAAPVPTTANPLSAAQAATLEQVKSQVAEVRGLAWKAPLDLQIVSKAVLAEQVRIVNQRDRRPERIRGDGEVLKLLKLIPRTSDYEQSIDDLYSGAVIGFYDPKTKKMLVAADGGVLTPGIRLTIAHEMLHALTDQQFGFGPRTDALDIADRQEELFGYIGLLEGDAKLLEAQWSKKYLTAAEQRNIGTQGDAGAYARAPKFLKDSLLFPYTAGLDFVVKQYRKAGGFAGVDAAYRNPPTSTEQILHPDIYAAGQGWSAPAIPALAAATGCTAVRDGTIGEFEMAEVLDASIGDSEASAAASGWSGDRYSAVRCGTALGMADRWIADSEDSAVRLFNTLTRWARSWSGSAAAVAPDGRFAGPAGSGRVIRNGARVDIVLADDGPTSDKIVAALG